MEEKVEDVLEFAQTIVIGNRADEFRGITERLRQDQVMVDLVRVDKQASGKANYDGICW